MGELVLIKTTTHPDISGNEGLPLEAVIGISRANSPTTVEHGYALTGNEAEEAMSTPGDLAERIAEFFEQTQAKAPGDRPLFNCHSFVAYTSGALATAQCTQEFICTLEDQKTAPTQLLPATPYAIIDRQEQHRHSTLGIDRPAYSMGILGTNNPLTICANGLLEHWYNGCYFAKIEDIPRQS